MKPMVDNDDVQTLLAGLGIVVPIDDVPFLQRSLVRQRQLLRGWRDQVPPDTEPAHVFRTASDGARE